MRVAVIVRIKFLAGNGSSRQKHGKPYFGYKLSINVDNRYKRNRFFRVSIASEYDAWHLEYVAKGYVDIERKKG